MESKRKTLGGLSLNQLNSRASLAPARLNKDGKHIKVSLGGRPSLAGSKGFVNPGNGSSRLNIPAGIAPRRYSSSFILATLKCYETSDRQEPF